MPHEVAPAYDDETGGLAAALFTQNYDKLLSIARARRRRSDRPVSLATTEILHEAYLRLSDSCGWRSQTHFFNAVALAVRQVIIDHARHRLAEKRDRRQETPLEDVQSVLPEFRETPEQIVAMAGLLEAVERESPRWMRVLDCRYFLGLTEEETAEALKLSVSTVQRDWRAVRAWLGERIPGAKRS